ncbi:MAG: hypothetical protein R3224_10240, partial [Balneolaceae bacterium]|nr:hypothetical protein [Balneolaceae bacterium]
LEPLPVRHENGEYRVVKEADRLVELASVTAALGSTSRYTWLKLPYTGGFERVAGATTLPIVILGGGRSSDIEALLSDLNEALSSGSNVRGAMFGRNVLYPDEVDSLALAEAIGRLVHGANKLEEVLNIVEIE